MDTQAHMGELALRRLRVGELDGAELERVRAHTVECAHCRQRLRALDDEQHAFEQQMPFERFSARVQRASVPATRPTPSRVAWLYPALGMAAMVMLGALAGPLAALLDRPQNRLKGGAQVALRVMAGENGPQRTAASDAPEPLGPGERVRIGYEAGGHGYVAAISIDAAGVVTPLYPEDGQSLPVQNAAGMQYLPQSLEFTGRGAEKVFVVLSDEPLSVEALRRAAEHAFEESGRDVTHMTRLEIPGEQFQRTLLKP